MNSRLTAPLLLAAARAGALALATRGGGAAAEQDPTPLLVRLEESKWTALGSGRWKTVEPLYAESFVSISVGPDGLLRTSNRAETFSPGTSPPAAEFRLSHMRVLRAGPTAAVVTYTATGPLGFPVTPMRLFATSVWARENSRWQTVFFHASPEN
jgi:hypothetical protein